MATGPLKSALYLIVFAVGLTCTAAYYHVPEAREVVPMPASQAESERTEAASPSSAIEVDIAGVADFLAELPGDERPQQLADWAAYGTLLSSGLSLEEIRDVTYDVAPVRLPELEEVLEYSFGGGRRLILPSGDVWLLYPESDEEWRGIVARMADRVRMELGEIPPRFVLYSYRSDVPGGTIAVRETATVRGSVLFSPEWGYAEASPKNADEMEAWLESVDDLTHVARSGRQGVVFGGRRVATSRRAGVGLEEVAALYQAHRGLERGQTELDEELASRSDSVIQPYSDAVDAFNEDLVPQYKDVVTVTPRFRSALDAAYRAVDLPAPKLDDAEPLEVLRDQFEAVESRLEPKLEEVTGQFLRQLVTEGRMIPSEPGFSLDPQWDVDGVIEDLRLLADSPTSIVRRARAISEGEDRAQDALYVDRNVVINADELVAAADERPADAVWVDPATAARARGIIREISGKTGTELEDGAIVPFLTLLRDSEDQEDPGLNALLRFIQADRRAQCARYDGDLQGTTVGMNLFYTDLLAKLWASVDYYYEAPTGEVPGFRSSPTDAVHVAPVFWDEVWKYPATRLWFGVRDEGYKGDPEDADGLNFAPIATRVYAAGSNPFSPGEETKPAERSRRVFGWWNQHYAAVADYEGEYHKQNQIMKWSIVTGWLVQNDVLPDLADHPVTRTHRFDEWYEESPSLRMKRPVPFLRHDDWEGGTECIEIIRSYGFPGAGSFMYVEGGVSLANGSAIKTATKIKGSVPKSLRRAAVNYDEVDVAAGKLQALRGTSFDVPRGRPLVQAHVSPGTRLRAGGSDRVAESFRVAIEGSKRDGRFGIAADRSPLGDLRFEKRPSGVSLHWNSGVARADKAAAERAADLLRFGGVDDLAVDPRFLPTQGEYVLSRADGSGEVIRLGLGGSGGGRAPPPPARRLVWGDPGEGPKRTSLRTAGEPPTSSASLIFEGILPTRKTVYVAEISEAEARARIQSLSWQRLTPSPLGSNGPGRVGRVFTDVGPSPEAKLVTVRRGSAGDKIETFVEPGGEVFVRQPKTGRGDLIEVVTREGIDHDFLVKLAETAEAEGSAQLSAGRALGLDAAKQVGKDDPVAAVKTLIRASEEDVLGDAVTALRTDPFLQTRVRAYGSRAPPSLSLSTDPLTTALAAVRRGDPSRAMAPLKSAVKSSELPEETLRELAAAGHRGAADAARLRQGRSVDVADAVVEVVDLEQVGRRIHSMVPKSALGEPELIPVSGRAAFREQLANLSPGEIYVEESRLLSTLDFDGRPGPSLARIIPSRDVQVEIFDSAPFGSFRPGVVVERSRPAGKAGAETVAASETRYVGRSLPVSARSEFGDVAPFLVVIRSCDLDEDGQVSEAERQICHGPVYEATADVAAPL